MDDGFLMRVLYPLANSQKELQALPDGEALDVAVFRDRHAGHMLHDEIGLAIGRRSGVEDLGDGGMIHHGERLPFGAEAQ